LASITTRICSRVSDPTEQDSKAGGGQFTLGTPHDDATSILSPIDRGLHFLSCYQNLCADTKGHRAVILSAAWQHQIFKINVGIRRTWDSGSHLGSFLHTGMQNKTGITDEAFEYNVRKKNQKFERVLAFEQF